MLDPVLQVLPPLYRLQLQLVSYPLFLILTVSVTVISRRLPTTTNYNYEEFASLELEVED